jgi:hypothetical protein
MSGKLLNCFGFGELLCEKPVNEIADSINDNA